MTPVSAHSSVVRDVIRQNGGLSDLPGLQNRAESLLADIQPYAADAGGPMPRVRVLATDRPVAFAVAPRDLFVSRGLLSIATDHQLRASLAHELGHLDEDAGHARVSSLVGEAELTCPEARADRFAVGLLTRAELQPEAMGSLLCCLMEHPSTDAPLKEDLAERIALLAPAAATSE